MATVRVRETVSVEDPEAPGQRVALLLNKAYDDKHPLVRTYPWAFSSDVEQATASPGEKRSVRRG